MLGATTSTLILDRDGNRLPICAAFVPRQLITPGPDAVSGAPEAASTYVVDRGAANWCWHGSNRRGALRNEALLAICASLTSKMKNPAEAGLKL